MTLISIMRPNAKRKSHHQKELSDLMNGFSQVSNGNLRNQQVNPAVNIFEQAKSYQIQMAVPGYKKDDFSIDVDKDLLTISAKIIDFEPKDENYIIKEFSRRSFVKNFTLGESIDPSQIEASYSDGILSIILQKKEEAIEKPPRIISVN